MFEAAQTDSLASRLIRNRAVAALDKREFAALLDRMHELEDQGYDLLAADGTAELLVREAVTPGANPFEVTAYEVSTRMQAPSAPRSVASVSLKVNGSVLAAQHTRSGPIEALDSALRGCLSNLFPAVLRVQLTDFRVAMIEPERGASARVAVTIDWKGPTGTWTTMGISENIIEASWIALENGVRLELMRAGEQDASVFCLRDESWAV